MCKLSAFAVKKDTALGDQGISDEWVTPNVPGSPSCLSFGGSDFGEQMDGEKNPNVEAALKDDAPMGQPVETAQEGERTEKLRPRTPEVVSCILDES